MSVGSVLLWILAGILAVLLALLVLPVGVRVCYDVSGLRICLLAGPIRWQLLPAKSKWWFKRRTKDKPAPPARPAGKPAGKPKPAHKGGAWSNLKPYLPVFRNLLLGLRRRLLGKALPQSFVLLPELRHGLLHSLLRLPGKAEFCRIRCADVRNTIFNIQFPVPEPSGPQRNVLFQHCIASLRLRARDPPSSRALCHDAFIICQPYFRLFRMASSSS